jgi:hypothetical protein
MIRAIAPSITEVASHRVGTGAFRLVETITLALVLVPCQGGPAS